MKKAQLIIEKSTSGHVATSIPALDIPERDLSELIPRKFLRTESPRLPEISEPELVRHYIGISTKNHHVDKDLYPLGSCTMKYNPKINDWTASALAEVHPYQPEELSQGLLGVYHELEQQLCAITGMTAFTLQPAAGSQGELVGVLLMRKYHELRGNDKDVILIPDAAHGTNPASVAMAGYKVVEVKSNSKGLVDLEDFESKINDRVAGFMLTNPNTLGLFEENISKISELIHGVDGIMYMDGANMNALLGIARPADLGFDITHLNLHKTFSTPHGGGGPGAGPIGVTNKLAAHLPRPRVELKNHKYRLEYGYEHSIGRVHGFYGNFGILLRAWTYIRMLGPDGLRNISEIAISNANYMMHKLKDVFELAYDRTCMHEFVLSAQTQKEKGTNALHIAKRLLDFGFHSPTMYFPLIVKEALMIEPTESENKETMDRFISVMKQIAEEVETNPELVHSAPHSTPVGKVDETYANRNLNVHW
ncbi:MAG: aminomethyl-transferring glycine dehydrogenase subunit GcvPB [Candidatus Marinimicrobia bacterium]|jgi:glycine dehydrogenase subunit 2|nr:aminomethyl-transferring glycine dehydrogenase subunit GcvPB [Candidatus Neomarinimicrobiota bacterium]MBT3574841.1 aminomethyl-transferring glycine dehydrogenase subunit GcvPB [Candidatus Neomarinimicrobiota bacterium]MBT3679326.1 aminomethyl-transferring glycine dehydrogenase subunit GcvPB [Candidatus Neomarinimicrobiota bacterium]MBT3951553.1 aminomethyl-transferring glycine dehydrogenase subunit GcvPB [Candidatus Neomarinimicrobiota bacterium]MBT4252470.1 aminomethyl-transferring glycine